MKKSNLVKAKFKISKVLFPKTGELILGEYSIISCNLIKCLTPENPIILNKTYNNFSILSYTPVVFNFYDEYVGSFEPVENQYGTSYKLVELDNAKKELTEGDKRTFLETVLTKNQVENLYFYYDNPYDLIKEKNKEKLLQVKGIGEKNIDKLFKKYDENLKFTALMTELKEYNLTRSLMERLLLTYKTSETVIKKIRENPYILADEVNGIGFKKADAIALSAGMPRDSLQRLEAFFVYYLSSAAEEGFSWITPDNLFSQIEPNLGIKFSPETIVKVVHSMHDKDILLWNENKTKMYLRKYYELEENIYQEILRIQKAKNNYTRNEQIEKEIVNSIEKEVGFNLTEEQNKAVNTILNNNISILTAFAGCGKTFLIRVFTQIFKSASLSVALCTLSGKASARIQEATGFEGSTIHRLLNYNPTLGFGYNSENHLPYDVIIVDESSFIGGELFYSLIQAIRTGAKLILVGDDKQLPAIGMCNIFFDMINSKKIPIARLTQIHRQAQKSGIMVASKLVREGTQLAKNGWTGAEVRGELKDFTIDLYNNKLYGNPKMLDWYKHFVHSLEDTFKTQIIVPMKYRGDFNTFDLNNQIQEIYNPHSSFKNEILLTKNGKNYCIREGDKVINRQNDYKAVVYLTEKEKQKRWLEDNDDENPTTEIFNGFCGKVTKIFDNKIVVKFDLCEEEILFSFATRNNLELAYALTTHLFQGSQIENVIFGMDNGSYIMNTRELVYTAITRASKECVLLAEADALKHSINTSQTINKQTFLKDMLQENSI